MRVSERAPMLRRSCTPPLWEAGDALQTVHARLGDIDVRTTMLDTHGLPASLTKMAMAEP
jgi:hypothetical protein